MGLRQGEQATPLLSPWMDQTGNKLFMLSFSSPTFCPDLLDSTLSDQRALPLIPLGLHRQMLGLSTFPTHILCTGPGGAGLSTRCQPGGPANELPRGADLLGEVGSKMVGSEPLARTQMVGVDASPCAAAPREAVAPEQDQKGG